ncbi:DUF4411 family protein [Methanobrevibacter curvatus]|uniref:DUF4411 family protein n=1 Tax=Methanobrevibacter curvatus TaxID=49547 RepID=A0A162FCS1_9EURY|nr:DUF4411 family protein [Methanobrevibacter curvatus]KZX11105.1 hypothetical protein MBCUR_15400 [Methanobrevibacter curvatus]
MYVLDTNVLLALQNHYFPEVFITLWKDINGLIENNNIMSITEVQEEITSKEHKIFWDKINTKHKHVFYKELESNEEEEMAKIESLKIYSKITLKNQNNKTIEWSLQKEWGEGVAVADPLLICHGLKHGSTIVTTESPKNQYNIPHVCKELNVNCIGIKDFFIENRLRF